MDVQTLTDSSIQAALATARDRLGEHVVLIESSPATEDAPAEITVMVDEPAVNTAREQSSRGRVPKPSEVDAAVSTARNAEPEAAGGADVGHGSPPQNDAGPTTNSFNDHLDSASTSVSSDALSREEETGRGHLFPTSGGEEEVSPQAATRREEMIEARLELLENRLGGLGRGRNGRVNAGRWAAHPLFGMLLDEGMRPDTVTTLFQDLTERGLDPDSSSREELRWALAQVVCRRIQVSAPTRAGTPLVAVGPGGAGKTSLLLKLALQDRVWECPDPTIIHLLPNEGGSTAYQNPTTLYQRFGLPVQSVRSEEEMAKALKRTNTFGQVLIDTPPLPRPLDDARATLRRFSRLLRPLHTVDVHFVLNATHALDTVDENTIHQLPLSPTATAITHLDEARSWGRVVEWLVGVDLPVQFVSDGPHVPDSARVFSLKWFVQDVLAL